ncbi:RICIN domain-containing protein [Streptomyces sp. NPDC002144]
MRTKKFAALASAAAMVGTLFTVLSPSAAQAVGTCCYYLKNGNGKYLAASGANAVVKTSGLPFTLIADGGYLTLWQSNANLNLGLSGNASSSGTRAVYAAGSSSYTQDWSRSYLTDTTFLLKNRANASVCLGISGGSTGTDVYVFTCSSPVATNQIWSLV